LSNPLLPATASPRYNSAPTPTPPPTVPEEDPTTTISDSFRNLPVPEEILSHPNPNPIPHLTTTQLAAINLLASGANYTTTAARLKIDPRTLYNWRKDPAFQAHLELRRDDFLGQATDQYRTLLIDTLNILFAQAKNPYPPIAHKAAHSLIALSRIGYHLAPSSSKESR
jgi:hypothetical protein